MKKTTRILALVLSILLFVQPIAFAASVADFSDFPHGWSTEAVTAAVENGLLIGEADGKIYPERNLTRAELAAFITRAFGATVEKDISHFTDVKPSDWFYSSVAKAYNMGALNGRSATVFAPDDPITREEVFTVLARVMCYSGSNDVYLNPFSDKAKVSDWAKASILGLLQKDYIHGYPDGTLRPDAYITREELAQMFHNIFKLYISAPGYYTDLNINGSVMVRSPGVHLESSYVSGDVVIADGVGKGNFDISSVNIGMRLLARGGEGTVTVKDVKLGDVVTVFDVNGTVNFHNYRDEAPFKGIIEHTPATFLKREAETTGGGGGGGGDYGSYLVTYVFPTGNQYVWVRSGATLTEPTAPQQPGKTFLYWSTTLDGSSGPFDFSTRITKKLTLYPVFTDSAFTVKFVSEGEELTAYTLTDVPYGSFLEDIDVPADPVSSDIAKKFAYWTVGDVEVSPATYAITEDTTFVAYFTDKAVHAVEFYNDDGTVLFDTVNTIDGETLNLPSSDPTKPGHTFSHWSATIGGTDYGTPAITADGLKLYAVFTPDQFTVKFFSEGSELTAYTDTIDYGCYPTNIPTDPTSSDPHKVFAYWAVEGDEDTEVDPASYAITEDTNFVAVFDTVYTVRFFDLVLDPEDQLLNSVTVKSGESIDPSEIPELYAYEGYFKGPSLSSVYTDDYTHEISEGWFIVEGGDWAKYDPDAAVTSDLDVYMNVKQIEIRVKVPKISNEYDLPISFYYNDLTRVIDSAKDAIFTNESGICWDYNHFVKDKLYEKLAARGLIDLDGNIANVHRYIYLVEVLGKGGIEEMIWDFVSSTVDDDDSEVKRYIRDHINTMTPAKKVQMVPAMTEAFNQVLASESATAFVNGIKPTLLTLITSDKNFFIAALKAYVSMKCATPEGKAEIKDIINAVLDEIRAESPTKKSSLDSVVANFIIDRIAAEQTALDTNPSASAPFSNYIIDYITAHLSDYKDQLASFLNNNVDENKAKAIARLLAKDEFDSFRTELVSLLEANEDIAKATVADMIRNGSTTVIDLVKNLIRDELGVGSPYLELVDSLSASDLASAVENGGITVGTTPITVTVSGKEEDIVSALENVASLRNTFIDTYVESAFAAPEAKAAFAYTVADIICANVSDLKTNDNVKDVIRGAGNLILKDIATSAGSSYRGIITAYVDSLENYNVFVNEFVNMPESLRNDIIDAVADLIDDDIMLALRTLVEDILGKFVKPGSVFTEDMVSNMIDLLLEDPAKMNNIVNVLCSSLSGSTLAQIAAVLGHSGTNTQIMYINQLIYELENKEEVTVTQDRLFMFYPIYSKLGDYSFEKVWQKFEPKLSRLGSAATYIPKEDIKVVFDRIYNGYMDEFKAAMDNAEADAEGVYHIGSGVQIDLNPISDVLVPAFRFASDMKGLVDDEAGFIAKTFAFAEKLKTKYPALQNLTEDKIKRLYKYYQRNPYIPAFDEYLDISAWLDGSDNGYIDPMSGYAIKPFEEYYTMLEAFSVVTDDLIQWFYNDANVAEEDRELVYDYLEAHVLEVANLVRHLVVKFAQTGVPSNLKALVEQLETDPELRAYLHKYGLDAYFDKVLDNKYIEKIINNGTIGSYYTRAEAKIDARLEKILDLLAASAFNRVYDDEEYEKGKEALRQLFKEDPGYTADTVADRIMNGADTITKSFGDDIIVTVTRSFFIPVTDVSPF